MKQLHIDTVKVYNNFNIIELKIINVNPLSLGIIINDCFMGIFIPFNS